MATASSGVRGPSSSPASRWQCVSTSGGISIADRPSSRGEAGEQGRGGAGEKEAALWRRLHSPLLPLSPAPLLALSALRRRRRRRRLLGLLRRRVVRHRLVVA